MSISLQLSLLRRIVLTNHMNTVSSLVFSKLGKYLVSAGRDNIISVWDVENGTLMHTIPTFKSIEGITILPDSWFDSSTGICTFVL